jgi:predicted ATPase/DNA-binding CsgD family transcriptional regulator
MPGSHTRKVGNLPSELSSFIGRRRELGEVKRLLAGSRLVTLTGVGGTGKTRLALRVSAELLRAFPDGAWFVDLTRLHTAGLLAPNVHDVDVLAFLVGATLGLSEQGGEPLRGLAAQLADRRVLLVLDNCEHLIPAAAILADALLRRCPELRILATGREPLSIAGETVFSVPPLSTPGPEPAPGLADLARCEAVALFVTRAGAVDNGFALTQDNRVAVAELCHRLDGLPLAIELAAARIGVLSAQQILDRLSERFALLSRGSRAAPPRQQTLRGCVDWSFDLCAKPERVLWARLSVFAGGFELDAVEGVCADECLPGTDLLDLVADLVAKSILIRDDVPDGRAATARYRMLETLRDYGRERLIEADEDAPLRRRHRDWHRQLVARAGVEWLSHRQAYWTARLGREHPNLRAAVEYCLAEPGEAEEAVRMVVTLPLLYWWSGGLFTEGRRWLDLALARATAPTTLRALALLFDGRMAISQDQPEIGMRLLEEGEILARRLDAPVELAFAAYVRATAAILRGDLSATIGALESMPDILSTVRQPESGLAGELRLARLNTLGTAAALAGDHGRAEACFTEVMRISERLGEHRYRFYALWAKALSEWQQGQVRDAGTTLEACLRLAQRHGQVDSYGTTRCVEVAAWVAAGQQKYDRAATLLGAADALWTDAGTPVTSYGHLIGHHDTCERQSRAGLGDAAFADAFARGRTLSYDDAIAYALHRQRTPAASRPAGAPAPLTRREQQIAGLIAEGFSDKDIAASLVISRRTAESHVQHILAKLGYTSRAQVAAWMAARHGET